MAGGHPLQSLLHGDPLNATDVDLAALAGKIGHMFGRAELAAVLTHIRSQWGNTAAPVTADAVAAAQASGPFAAAVNLRFVPKSQYASTPLADGDQIEIIAPVTGG